MHQDIVVILSYNVALMISVAINIYYRHILISVTITKIRRRDPGRWEFIQHVVLATMVREEYLYFC